MVLYLRFVSRIVLGLSSYSIESIATWLVIKNLTQAHSAAIRSLSCRQRCRAAVEIGIDAVVVIVKGLAAVVAALAAESPPP